MKSTRVFVFFERAAKLWRVQALVSGFQWTTPTELCTFPYCAPFLLCTLEAYFDNFSLYILHLTNKCAKQFLILFAHIFFFDALQIILIKNSQGDFFIDQRFCKMNMEENNSNWKVKTIWKCLKRNLFPVVFWSKGFFFCSTLVRISFSLSKYPKKNCLSLCISCI